MPTRMPFAQKVTVLVTVLITLSSVCITGVAAYQFRRELYLREYQSAFTVYMAAANYLSAHYKTHRSSFRKKSLDFVLSEKFLRLEDEHGQQVTHRPSRLAVYNGRGDLIYEYAEDGTRTAPTFIVKRDLPTRYRQSYDPKKKSILVAGLISPDGDIPGFVYIDFPSDIQAQVAMLYRNTFAVMAVVILIALGFSSVMTRRLLKPVESLIHAAKKVRRGDLDQHVIVTGEDEIGLLAQTFNEMVGSLGRRIALMHRMQEWTMELSRVFDMNELFNSFLDMCGALSPAKSFRLFLYDAETEDLVMSMTHDAGGVPQACDEAFVRRAFDEGATRFLEEDGSDVVRSTRPVEIAIPLIAGGMNIGAIWIGKPRQGDAYDDETITVLETMAQHAAAAIENVRLYNELSEKERYEREMALARQIQAGMLPAEMPKLVGYEVYGRCQPAFEVGGDYYDFIPAGEDGRWYFVIGDVSGKGVAAAMIVSIVRTLIHTCVQFEPSAVRVLKWVNRNLSPDLKSDMFVTMSFLVLRESGEGPVFLRAGHEPALLARKDGSVERILPEGTALGLLDLPLFESLLKEQRVEIEPGDTLLLYTDGITEAVDEEDEEFGWERLELAVASCAGKSPKEMVDCVIGEVAKFVGDAPQHDDMTLIAVRKQER